MRKLCTVCAAIVLSVAGCGDDLSGAGDAGFSDAEVPVDDARVPDAERPDATPNVATIEFVELSSSVDEAGGAVVVELVVRTTVPTDVAASVVITASDLTAVEPFDFDATPVQVDIPEGTDDGAVVTASFPVQDDLAIEAPESFEVSITEPINVELASPFTHTVTILDNDQAGLWGLGRYLTSVDLAAGAKSFVGAIGLSGVYDIDAMTYDHDNGRLLAINNLRELWEIDISTNQWSLITLIPSASYFGMTIDDAGIVWAMDRTEGRLYRIDPVAHSAEAVDPAAAMLSSDVFFDAATDTLYGVNQQSIYTIDRVTSVETLLGVVDDLLPGNGSIFNCDVSPFDGLAYCTTFGDGIYSLDLITLDSTHVGDTFGISNQRVTVGPAAGRVLVGTEERLIHHDVVNDTVVDDIAIGIRSASAVASVGDEAQFWVCGDFRRLFSVDVGTGDIEARPQFQVGIVALAYDPVSGTLFGLQSGAGLVSIDTTTSEVTPVSLTFPSGFTPIALAINPADGGIWLASSSSLAMVVVDEVVPIAGSEGFSHLAFADVDELVGTRGRDLFAVSMDDGVGALIRQLPRSVSGLASYSQVGGVLAVEDESFYEIYSSDGAFAFLDGFDLPRGFAIDEQGGSMYTAIDSWLYSIEPDSGRFVAALDMAGVDLNAVAFASTTRILWAAERGLSSLDIIAIDVDTFDVMTVGTTMGTPISAMTFDPSETVLYGAGGFVNGPVSVYQIDQATGVATVIATIDEALLDSAAGMTFDAAGELIVAGNTGRVVMVDLATGASTVVANSAMALWGLDRQQ